MIERRQSFGLLLKALQPVGFGFVIYVHGGPGFGGFL